MLRYAIQLTGGNVIYTDFEPAGEIVGDPAYWCGWSRNKETSGLRRSVLMLPNILTITDLTETHP